MMNHDVFPFGKETKVMWKVWFSVWVAFQLRFGLWECF